MRWRQWKIIECACGHCSSFAHDLKIEYGEVVMSKYISFVAVDSKTLTAGDHGITLAVPVPMPAGVRYDTTVSE